MLLFHKLGFILLFFVLGKSERTVRRIVIEGSQNKGKFGTPAKRRKGRPRKELDNFDKCAVRQKIQFFYTVRKEVPTLSKLLATLRKDINYDGSREHLRQLLKAIGFKYKKCQSSRKALLEKSNIAFKREQYLQIIMENRNLPEELRKEIIFLDESYIHSSYKLKKCWQSIDTEGVVQDISKGKRWIIVHAGNEKGFVPGALLIFSGTNKEEDYHSEMNQHNFIKWVKEKLIPNLSESSIIVMDNAPYHSVVKNKAPTSSTRVADIKQWLHDNNVPFDTKFTKPLLLNLVKKHKPAPIYEIDELLSEFGHTVVRLPPYHCDLNPIELIWSLAKRKVASFNVGGATNIKALMEDAFNKISTDDWKRCCEHVKKIEKEYYQRSKTLYNCIDKLIITLGEYSSSSESEADSEVEDMHEDPVPGSSHTSRRNLEMFFPDCQSIEYDEEYLDFDLLD